MADFVIIHIERKPASSFEEVKTQMDLALDWFRIKETLWITYTTSTVDKWYERLQPLVDPDGYLFICVLDVKKRNGWMSKEFWNWLKKSR